MRNNTVDLTTYGYLAEEGQEEKELLFSVPEKWLSRTLHLLFNTSLQEFKDEYGWDESEVLYRLAETEGVVIQWRVI